MEFLLRTVEMHLGNLISILEALEGVGKVI